MTLALSRPDAGVRVPRAEPVIGLDVVDMSDDRARARKLVLAEDPYLSGHYPDVPIFPGVFTIDSVVQTARALLIDREPGSSPQLQVLVSAQFTAPLRPGDRFEVAVHVLDPKPVDPEGTRRIKAQCIRGDGITAGRMTLLMGGIDR